MASAGGVEKMNNFQKNFIQWMELSKELSVEPGPFTSKTGAVDEDDADDGIDFVKGEESIDLTAYLVRFISHGSFYHSDDYLRKVLSGLSGADVVDLFRIMAVDHKDISAAMSLCKLTEGDTKNEILRSLSHDEIRSVAYNAVGASGDEAGASGWVELEREISEAYKAKDVRPYVYTGQEERQCNRILYAIDSGLLRHPNSVLGWPIRTLMEYALDPHWKSGDQARRPLPIRVMCIAYALDSHSLIKEFLQKLRGRGVKVDPNVLLRQFIPKVESYGMESAWANGRRSFNKVLEELTREGLMDEVRDPDMANYIAIVDLKNSGAIA